MLKKSMRGLTLVELMVAMSIGLLVVLLCAHTYSIIKQQEQRVKWQQDIDEWFVDTADELTAIFHQVGFENIAPASTPSSLNIQRAASSPWLSFDASVTTPAAVLVPSMDLLDLGVTPNHRRMLVPNIQAAGALDTWLHSQVASGAAVTYRHRLILNQTSLDDARCDVRLSQTASAPAVAALCQFRVQNTSNATLLSIQPSLAASQVLGYSFVLEGGLMASTPNPELRTAFRVSPLLQGMPALHISFRRKTTAGTYQFEEQPTDWQQVDAMLLSITALSPTPRGYASGVGWFTSPMADASGRPLFEGRRYRVLIPR